jgi:predicted dithiol-disulfide oxidoreductase (DUF899 family)
MPTATAIHPPIVSRADWLAQRTQLLKREKEATRQRDRLAAERRRLPMVRLEKDYFFDGPAGKRHLRDLFDGRAQLIIYHFMFEPDADKGCPGCTGFINAMGDLSLLGERNTAFALVSRAPLAKLEAYKKQQGWDRPWYSSFGSDFNYDFHVTLDEKVCPIEYNYRSKAELVARNPDRTPEGESPGFSVFFRVGDDVCHAYSTYARGAESLTDAYSLLDVTPYGRQEDWEDSPDGWPQKPTYS